MGFRNVGDVHVELDGSIRFKGRLGLTVVRPDGTVRDHREGNNIMCTAGLTVLAQALVWSGIQDQAANLGVTSPNYLTPLWGAVGNGSGTVSAGDVALFNELSRQTVGAGASSPATPTISAAATWLFYFPQPSVPWTLTEAGVFANGSSNNATVATAGTLIDHWSFSPSITVPTTDTLILQASFSIT